MLLRLRSIVRRRPGVLVALVLAVVGAQGVAGTLSWCLNGAAPQVVNAAVPCHAEPGNPDDVSPGNPGAVRPHIEAATDAGVAQASVTVAPVGPPPVLFRLQADADLEAGSGASRGAPGCPGIAIDVGPPSDPALPGRSVRLLI